MTATAHPNGICECRDHCPCGHRRGPVAYVVTREGERLRVCPLCLWASDQIREILAKPRQLPIYQAYDAPTARTLERLMRRYRVTN